MLNGIEVDPSVQIGITAVVGVVLTHIAIGNHPKRRIVGHLLFFAALTAVMLQHGVVPYGPSPIAASLLQRSFLGLAKIIWWANAAWSLIGFVRVFLIFEKQPREGRLMQDLVVGIIYVGAILSVIAYVFDAPVGTLIATSGVFAIILGLALQSTLSDVFSGIALNLGRPYGIGDRLVLNDGIEGRVVETNWRATHLLNYANDLVIVPNSDLAKARLTNLSSPERSHGAKLSVRIAPTASPSVIAEVMHVVLLSSNTILFDPEPGVQVKSMDAAAIELELSFRVADAAGVGKAQNEIFDLVFRHAKAAGLRLAPPLQGGGFGEAHAGADAAPGHHLTTSRRLLDAIPLFSALTDEEKDALAATMTRRTVRKDEVVVEQGATLHALMIIRSGAVSVTRYDKDRAVELSRLAPGDSFGERGLLTGAGEPGTIRALTTVVVYEIGQECLAPLMRERPSIAEDLGATLARRSATAKHLLEPGQNGAGPGSAPHLVARIRQLFSIPPDNVP